MRWLPLLSPSFHPHRVPTRFWNTSWQYFTISFLIEILRTSSIFLNHTSLHESTNMSSKTTSSSSVQACISSKSNQQSHNLESTLDRVAWINQCPHRPVIHKNLMTSTTFSAEAAGFGFASDFSASFSWNDYSEISMVHLRFLITARVMSFLISRILVVSSLSTIEGVAATDPYVVDEGTTSLHCLKLYIK